MYTGGATANYPTLRVQIVAVQTMKVVVILLGLITTTLQSGEAAVTVRIRAYNASGELDIRADGFTLGSRVLLTCDVKGLSPGSDVLSYKWQRTCTGGSGRCDIQEEDCCYRVVKDTLLVDVLSVFERMRYYCEVEYRNHGSPDILKPIPSTPYISATGSSAPYLFTPTSLLLNNAHITSAQQVSTKNKEQWINCTSGNGQSGSVQIYSVDNTIIAGSVRGTATSDLSKYINGFYYCFETSARQVYFSVYIKNSTTLPTPTVHVQSTTEWTFTSPDGSQVETYIVEFQCRVRNITFAVKYMNVSVSQGGVQIQKNASCFRIGRLYKLKVWAVSGPNISQARECLVSDRQCREEGTTRATSGSTATKLTPSISRGTSSPGTDHANMQDEGDQTASKTYIGVGVGVGVAILLVLLTVVVIILVAVMMRRKAVHKQKREKKTRDKLYYNNAEVEKQEVDMKEKDLEADYDYVDNDQGEEKGSIADGFDPYEDPDRKAQIKTAMKPDSKESSTLHWESEVGDVYAVVNKTKKKGVKKKETEDEPAVTNKDDLYAMPMKKKAKMTDTGKGVVECGDVEEGEESNNKVGLQYEPMADSEPRQKNEEEGKAPDVNMLYAVVDKSCKEKK